MRTKSLLFSAALGAIGLSGALGQVYSQNVVGYITITAPKGLSIIANQLDNKNGNKLNDVLPAVPDGSTIHFFSNGSYTSISYFGGWDPNTAVLAPGGGAFLDIPSDATDAARKLTFVGEVLQKADSNSSIPAGLSIISSKTPRAGKLTTDLKFPAGEALDGSNAFQYNNASKGYVTSDLFGGWAAEPSVAVGEGFFFFNANAAAQAWNQDFEVK